MVRERTLTSLSSEGGKTGKILQRKRLQQKGDTPPFSIRKKGAFAV